MNRTRLAFLLAAAALAVGLPLAAQPATVVYELENVLLDPVTTHPWEEPRPMTGSFAWTYVPGDFENGFGTVLDLDLPWWGSDLTELIFTIDTGSMEINLDGNYHDLGVDVTLFFVEPLHPDLPSAIDTARSKFEIQVGVVRQGTVVSGNVVPGPAVVDLELTGSCPGTVSLTASGLSPEGPVALLWSSSEGSDTVPVGRCTGTELGLSSPALLTVVRAGVDGQVAVGGDVPGVACSRFVQVLDATTCVVSDVVPISVP